MFKSGNHLSVEAFLNGAGNSNTNKSDKHANPLSGRALFTRNLTLSDIMEPQWGDRTVVERITDVNAAIDQLTHTKYMDELKAEVSMLDKAIEAKLLGRNDEQTFRPRFQNRRHTQPSFKYDVVNNEPKKPVHAPQKRNSLPPIINEKFHVHRATKLAWGPFDADNNNVKLPKLRHRFPSFSNDGLYLRRAPYVIDEEPSDKSDITLKVSASSEFSRVMLDFRDLKLT